MAGNASSSSGSVPPPKVASEDIISQKTDLCISNTIVKTGLGFSAGVVASVLLFRRRSFPVWIGTGFGLGSGYTDCERSFNPISVPGVRIVPSSSLPSSSSSDSAALPAPSSFERLQQRAGEALGAARDKADQQLAKSTAPGGLLDRLESKGKQGLESVKESVGIASDKVKAGAAKVEEKSDTTQGGPYKDCLTCRLTGAAALAVTGTGAFLEARRLGGALGPGPVSPSSLPTRPGPPSSTSSSPLSSLFSSPASSVSSTSTSRAWPRSLLAIGVLCYAGAVGRLLY